jgi:hypothetical protein
MRDTVYFWMFLYKYDPCKLLIWITRISEKIDTSLDDISVWVHLRL